MQCWSPAYVGIGSNLDDPLRQVQTAFDALARIPDTRSFAHSPMYRSAPMGPAEQPDYINAVAGLVTRLGPAELLAHLQRIEAAQGRARQGERWGARTLDLDLLLHGTVRIGTSALTLPHPGLTERNFVVYPLADVAPDLVLPDGQRLMPLLARLGTRGLEKLTGAETP